MPSRQQADYVVIDAKIDTGTGKTILVKPYRNVTLVFSTSDSADLTAKVAGATELFDALGNPYAPDFSASATSANPWNYLYLVDSDSGSGIPGSTGLVWTGTDAVRTVELNTDLIDYVTVNVTAISAGALTVRLIASDNS
jgi:hypothetical protein